MPITTRMATRLEVARKIATKIKEWDKGLGIALDQAVDDYIDENGLRESDALSQQVEDASRYYHLVK